MQRFRSAVMFLLAAILIVFAVAGCGATGNSQAAATKKDSITVVLPDEPTTLDVQKADDGNMRDVTDSVVEGLLAMDGQTLEPIPALATSYQQTSPTTWDFKLRQGVQFSNGDPFTADDVIYSIHRILDPALNSDILGDFQTIKSVQKVNDNEVIITTNGPDTDLPARLTLLKILDKKVMEADPKAISNMVIGTGPYKIIQWTRAQDITLTTNNLYWGPKPAIPNVTVRFIEEDATRAAALNNGEVDLAVNMLPEYVSGLPKVATVDGSEFGMVRFNVMNGVFKNQKVRMAAEYAIDNSAIAQSLYGGYATVANPMLQKKGYLGYDGNLQPYPYDPAKAKQLLQKAGYHGQQVQLYGETGRWLKDGELVQTVAQMLTKVGFNVSVKTLAFPDWLNILFDRSKAPDMIFTFHDNDIHDVDRTFSTYVESTGPGSSYPNTLDKEIDQARMQPTADQAQAMYEDISQKLYNDPAWIPLININDIYGMQKDVQYQPRRDSVLFLSAISFK